jgi:integrase
VPERTPEDKELNRQMLEKAIKIKAQRIDELTNNENGFMNFGLKQKANFIDYLQVISDNKKEAAKGAIRGTWQSYDVLMKHLILYKGDKIIFKDLTRDFCIGFIEYLKTAQNSLYNPALSETNRSGLLSQTTQHNYVNVLSVALNKAVSDGIIPNNPLNQLQRFERPKKSENNREYLTIEEVNQLEKTNCVRPIVKQAFLFCCFSGLRYSDVKALKWGDFQTDNDGKQVIRYRQKKTKKDEYLQLPDKVLKFIPAKGTATDKDTIFILSDNGYTNLALRSWVVAAGIKKRVTFHVSRHTNATLLLSLGVPIETVSKLLGHSEIKTTQIYAKVIDKNKRAAVELLNGLID